jgi:hypothetical protein
MANGLSPVAQLIAKNQAEVSLKDVLQDDERAAKNDKAMQVAERVVELVAKNPDMTVSELLALWQGALKAGAYHKTMARALLSHARLIKIPAINPFDPALSAPVKAMPTKKLATKKPAKK